MDILIAILWFLQLIMPGQDYTATEIEQLYFANEHIVQSIYCDEMMTNDVLIIYDNAVDNYEVGLIEIWDQNPIKQKR